ncbi:hypothetical protein JQ612_27565 [Bradyrhizobium manausense]|uniref:hypothetical protein n=1 Tax=Bradyrhizobium manausense TaxID=989370 RepID=UPI001BA64319|nr:hypothetical protein [Bradyrhizobium manausense]MBR0836970.1 hypothetical protein [Bradyrhizobium manausense]
MTTRMDRRTFLQGTSIAALCAAASRDLFGPNIADAAPAPLAAQGTKTTTSALGSLVAPNFNGGRSQVNLNFLQTGGDYPFINLLKTAQNWGFIDNSGWPEPSTLDADGYPILISNKGVYTVFFAPSQAARPGNYVVTWNGNGTIYLGMNNTAVSGSKTSTSGTGRYVFSTTETRFVVGISAIGSPRITNLQVFHAADEAALNAGQVFGARFKQRLVEAKFGVIRFLNWQLGNTTNVTTWATRKPVSYVFYAGAEFRPSLYAGLTTNDGSSYTAQLAGFKLVDKATVTVKFNASSSSSCTLNVNQTGAIPVLNAYSAPLSASNNSFPVGGTWQSLATLVYDATLKAWIKQGGDVAMGSVGLLNGCPPELMLRLCAEVGAHPYFVTPALSIDPATDYMPSLTAYCRDNGPAWMIPRFEGPNELWNGAGGFFQTAYANAKANAYGWGGDYHNWYGKALSILGQIVSQAYGGDRKRYHVLCGVQTAVGDSLAGTKASDPRLESTKYLAQSTQPQAPYSKTPAKNWVTHVACAQYITPSEYNTAQELTDATAFAAAVGNPSLQASIASAYASTVNSGTGRFTVGNVAKMYANWKSWAQSHGIVKLTGYEGGYSPDYGGTAEVKALRAASKSAPVLTTITALNYANFVGLTDATFVAEFPSCFQLSGRAPSGSAWAVLEDIYQSPNPPQWAAIVAFNNV